MWGLWLLGVGFLGGWGEGAVLNVELCHPLSILMRTILKGWPRWWGLEDTTGLDWAQGEVSWVKAWCQCLAVGQVSSWSFGVPVCLSPIVQGRGWRIWKNPHIRSMSVLLKGWKGLEPCFLLQGVGVGEVLASLDRDLSRSLPWLAEFWVLHSFDSLWAALNSLQDTWIVPCGWGHGPDQVSWWQVEEHHERRF